MLISDWSSGVCSSVLADDPELLDIEADAGAPEIDRILPPLCRDHRNVVIFGLVGRLERIGLGVSATSHTHENLRHQLMPLETGIIDLIGAVSRQQDVEDEIRQVELAMEKIGRAHV